MSVEDTFSNQNFRSDFGIIASLFKQKNTEEVRY